MANPLDQVQTVILLMMENRSFDHMLGHLTLDSPELPVEGLKAGSMGDYTNDYLDTGYPVFPFANDQELDNDLPHEYNAVATQMQLNSITGTYTMHGFVEAYADAGYQVNPQCTPMGYFQQAQVPITDFLARNFCVCDHWFSPLPASTQPNRTMALCGDTPIFKTKTQLIDIQTNLFDWMNANNIKWRVYHDGFSFYTLYPKLWPFVLGDNFKRFNTFYADQLIDPAPGDPQVIIIEPSYQDAPHFGSVHPNDNHAPLAVGFGEDFIRQAYLAATANSKRWAQTVMVLYYDEHGGFYDHVPPPAISYMTTESPDEKFLSLGPRIPGIVLSPWVAAGSAFSGTLDHTSVLQFLAEKFTPGSPFSTTVSNRKAAGIQSLTETLSQQDARPIPPVPTMQIPVETSLGKFLPTASPGDMEQSFTNAANALIAQQPQAAFATYPELVAWQDLQNKNNS
jgi:phospholipase C